MNVIGNFYDIFCYDSTLFYLYKCMFLESFEI